MKFWNLTGGTVSHLFEIKTKKVVSMRTRVTGQVPIGLQPTSIDIDSTIVAYTASFGSHWSLVKEGLKGEQTMERGINH